MSFIQQIEALKDGEVKRMCVYSQRDLEYMVGKGWSPVAPSMPPPPPPVIPTTHAPEAPRKRPGRPAKVKH